MVETFIYALLFGVLTGLFYLMYYYLTVLTWGLAIELPEECYWETHDGFWNTSLSWRLIWLFLVNAGLFVQYSAVEFVTSFV